MASKHKAPWLCAMVVVVLLTISTAALAEDASKRQPNQHTPGDGTPWSKYLAECGKHADNATATFDAVYRGATVEWAGTIVRILEEEGGGTGALFLRLQPSEAWLADVRLDYSLKDYPVGTFTDIQSIVFRARLTTLGMLFWQHTATLVRILEVFDGSSYAAITDHEDGITGPSWKRFVAVCGAAAYTNNSEAALAAFRDEFQGVTLNWAGTVRAIAPNTMYLKMSPSDAWTNDLIIEYHPEGNAESLEALQLVDGTRVWFHGKMVEHGGSRNPHKILAYNVHRLPRHLYPVPYWSKNSHEL